MKLKLFVFFALLGFTACKMGGPRPFYTVRLQSVTEEASNARISCEEDTNRLGYVNQAIRGELQELKQAAKSTSKFLQKAKRLGK